MVAMKVWLFISSWYFFMIIIYNIYIQLTYQELRHWLIVQLIFGSFYQRTSLHLAASGGHALTVKSLLDKGADISITDEDGVSYMRLHVQYY